MGDLLPFRIALTCVAVLGMGKALAASAPLDYLLHCSGCHGREGHGLPANGIPDLHEAGRWAATAAGREYLVQVPGISASGISNEDAARVLNWALEQFSAPRLPAGFVPFTAEEIGRLRHTLATDPDRRRRQLMQTGLTTAPAGAVR